MPNSKTLVDFDFDENKVPLLVCFQFLLFGYHLLWLLCLIARPIVTCVSPIYMLQSSSVLPEASIV